MAHFAKLGTGNIVEKVEVVSNDIATNEQAGVDFLNTLYGTRDIWKQTSYNGTIRKNFASAGYTYDSSRDAFVPPKPYASWVLDDATCLWSAPNEMPTDGKKYIWDEDSTSWVEVS